MSEPKIVFKERNRLVCTIACIMVPLMLAALICEIRALRKKHGCKAEIKCHMPERELVETDPVEKDDAESM